ncbi:SLIT and NTRK-like protein 2 [Dreissena polymorpha]|uniref:LRRCT domain-containing protein n=1 Tax=Dreissena polymorpha TaxID=45954 RepID=A0A9D4HWU9_DREPO|nr:SLIT and NTRK-like protein 2 [Dreissena polymorpha]KAH3735804.1 hypothetical protein DPMN_042362 [Dreissena polymorpha]
MAGVGILVNVLVTLICSWSVSAIEGTNTTEVTDKTTSLLRADRCKNVVENCFCKEKAVTCKGARFTNMDELSPYIKYTTTRISITNGQLTEFSGFQIQLDNLVYLNLSGNLISTVDMNAFRNMPYLNVVDLSNNPVRCIGDVFQPLLNIREMYMRNCNHPDTMGKLCMPEKMIPNVANLTFLEVLDLSANHFDTVTEDFRGFLCNKAFNIKTLILANNKFSYFSVDGCLTSLELLDISFNNFHSLSDEETKYIESIESLEQVKIEGNPFNCTCQIAGFATWLNTTQQPLDVNNIKCPEGANTPFAGKRIVDLDAVALCGEASIAVCFDGRNGDHTMHTRSINAIIAGAMFVAFLIIVTVMLMIYKRHRAKRTLRKGGYANANYYASEPSYDRINK